MGSFRVRLCRASAGWNELAAQRDTQKTKPKSLVRCTFHKRYIQSALDAVTIGANIAKKKHEANGILNSLLSSEKRLHRYRNETWDRTVSLRPTEMKIPLRTPHRLRKQELIAAQPRKRIIWIQSKTSEFSLSWDITIFAPFKSGEKNPELTGPPRSLLEMTQNMGWWHSDCFTV